MITIYGVTRSRASRAIWLLNELGQDYNQVPVIQAYRLANPDAPDAPLHTRSPEFLKVNPNGHIPSMVDGDLVLHESLAINLYIAKKFGGPLAPQTLSEDAMMTMWALWLTTELEPHTIQIMYHRMMKPEAERVAQIADDAEKALAGPFALLNAELAKTGYLVGGRFTVADINLTEVMRYATAAPALFDANPHVKTWFDACRARPAFKAMWAKRDAEPA